MSSHAHLHTRRRDHAAHVRHHRLGKDVVDEAVVADEPRVGDVLDAEAVVDVVLVLCRLDVDAALVALDAARLRVLHHRAPARLGLDVLLVAGRVPVGRHLAVVFNLRNTGKN